MSNRSNTVGVESTHIGNLEFRAITDEYDSGLESPILTGILPPPEFIELDDDSREIVHDLKKLNSGLRERLQEYKAQREED